MTNIRIEHDKHGLLGSHEVDYVPMIGDFIAIDDKTYGTCYLTITERMLILSTKTIVLYVKDKYEIFPLTKPEAEKSYDDFFKEIEHTASDELAIGTTPFDSLNEVRG